MVTLSSCGVVTETWRLVASAHGRILRQAHFAEAETFDGFSKVYVEPAVHEGVVTDLRRNRTDRIDWNCVRRNGTVAIGDLPMTWPASDRGRKRSNCGATVRLKRQHRSPNGRRSTAANRMQTAK